MAASTITRDTWTNDSGTAATPVGDGTLINNSALQNHIYARIDELFAGAGSYGTFTLGGRLAAEGFGSHAFSAGGTGNNSVDIRNTTPGTTNFAAVHLGNDGSATAAQLAMTSSTYTATGFVPQDGLLIQCGRAGGISFGTNHASGAIRFYTGSAAEAARLTPAGTLFLNDTTDATLADHGMCINHGAASGFSLTLKHSGVSRASGSGEADTFGMLGIQNANGGLSVYGMTAAGAGALPALELNAHGDTGTGDTTKNTAANGFVAIRASKNNTTIGANENVLAVINFNTTRFILDADGDSHQDVGTAWTNFDDHDDVALLHALSAGVSRKDDPLRRAFGRLLTRHRGTLERHRIVTFNRDGHHFINWNRAHMLTIGAVRQLGMQLQAMQARLRALEA